LSKNISTIVEKVVNFKYASSQKKNMSEKEKESTTNKFQELLRGNESNLEEEFIKIWNIVRETGKNILISSEIKNKELRLKGLEEVYIVVTPDTLWVGFASSTTEKIKNENDPEISIYLGEVMNALRNGEKRQLNIRIEEKT
jgi:hypothetical protein